MPCACSHAVYTLATKELHPLCNVYFKNKVVLINHIPIFDPAKQIMIPQAFNSLYN